jgi:hypothetical protein
MAVTKVTEDWKGIAGNTEVGLNGNTGTLTRRFDVSFDNSDDPSSRGIMSLTASAGGTSIPAYWDAHPYSSDYYVRKKSFAPNNGPLNWSVTVEYEYIENPLLQPYSLQFIPQSSQEAIDKAIELSGSTEVMTKNLCNSADEPFDPPIQEEFYDYALVIKRNESAFSMSSAQAFFNKVNSDSLSVLNKQGQVLTFAAGKVRCKSIQADEQRHGPTWYYAVTYEFVVREDGWKRRILDQGFRKKVSGAYTAIADSEGNPVTQPMKLNGSGDVLAAASAAVFLEFQTKYTKPFTTLNFV